MNWCFTLRDLMAGRVSCEILCMSRGVVVRRLVVVGDTVDIDFCPDQVGMPLDTKVAYDPWLMDRGSLLFECRQAPDGVAKLCTEFDVVRYDDGVQFAVGPDTDWARARELVGS